MSQAENWGKGKRAPLQRDVAIWVSWRGSICRVTLQDRDDGKRMCLRLSESESQMLARDLVAMWSEHQPSPCIHTENPPPVQELARVYGLLVRGMLG